MTNKFDIVFSNKWIEGNKELEYVIFKLNLIQFIKKVLGIYNTYTAKVLDTPKQVDGGWEYNVELTHINKHIFGIKYKTVTYVGLTFLNK